MPPIQPERWLVLGHWFESQPGPPSFLYTVLTLILAILIAGSLYAVFGLAARRFAGHRLHRRLARRFGWTVFGIALAGLLLIGARYLGLPFLSSRFLLLLDLLGLVSVAGFAAFYFRFRYPAARQAHEAEMLRLRYLPRPKPKPAGAVKRHHQKARGKRRT